MKLTKHERLSAAVVADVPGVFVSFALQVLRLRRVRRGVLHLDEPVAEDEAILAAARAVSRLTAAGRLPRAQHESEWRPGIDGDPLALCRNHYGPGRDHGRNHHGDKAHDGHRSLPSHR